MFFLDFPLFFGSWLFLDSFVEFGDSSEFFWGSYESFLAFMACSWLIYGVFWKWFIFLGSFGWFRDWFRSFSKILMIIGFSKVFLRFFLIFFASWLFLHSFVEYGDFSEFFEVLMNHFWRLWHVLDKFMEFLEVDYFFWVCLGGLEIDFDHFQRF